MSTPPRPLCAAPPPDLDWSREGTPASNSYDDIYFSVDGGLEETSAVFLQGCGLPENWQKSGVFTICELGFGSGLNFLATWALWNKTAPKDAHLHFLSVEAYPWTRDDLQKALSYWPALHELAEQLLAIWPGQVKGVHRLHLDNVTLTLFHTRVDTALDTMDACVDAWFLDGFSPSKNPDMWAEPVFTAMAKLSTPQARLATFTVAGHVRRGLSEAGFSVEKKPGFGRKRERLEAVYQGESTLPSPPLAAPPIIIGGGIAGASLARSFLRRGIIPVLIDPEPDLESAASGNPAALVMPRLDLQDRPESRFFLSAYLYALAQYRATLTPLQTGVSQIAKSDAEQVRFTKLLTQCALPIEQMHAMGHLELEAITGLDLNTESTGLYFPNALLIDPKAIIAKWSAGCTRIAQNVTKVERSKTGWDVCGEDGNVLAHSAHVFLCIGANVQSLRELNVRFTRGQICWGKSADIPASPFIYGGYAVPYAGGVLLGATHEHIGSGQNNTVRPTDTEENITQYSRLCGAKINAQDWKARAAIRVTTKNTLPISNEAESGLFVMSGLGARGFMMAPLLGEALVCKALGEPSPLCLQTSIRFGKKTDMRASK